MSQISEQAKNESVYRLHDTLASKLYFTYSKVDRSKGKWYLVYYDKSKKRQIWHPFGEYPELSPTQARKSLKAAAEAIAKQKGDRVIKAAAEASQVATVGDIAKKFLKDKQAQAGISSSRKDTLAGYVHNHIVPNIGKYRFDELSITLIKEQFSQVIMKTLAVATAKKVVATLITIFESAYKDGLITHNILQSRTSKDFIDGKVKPKDNRMNDVRLAKALKSFERRNVRVPTWALIKVLTLTFNRIGETVQSRWSHIDFKNREWRIPGTLTKTREPHIIYMSDELVEVLMILRRYNNARRRSVFLFPSQRKKGSHLRADSASAKVSEYAGRVWSAHDLRKWARTWTQENGIDYLIGEYLLNHQADQMDRTYIQTYAKDKCREAMALWGEHITELAA